MPILSIAFFMRIIYTLLILCCLCVQYVSEHILYSYEAAEWYAYDQESDEENKENKEDSYKQKSKTEEDKVHQSNKCTLPVLLYAVLSARKNELLYRCKFDIFGVIEYDGELNSPPPELYS